MHLKNIMPIVANILCWHEGSVLFLSWLYTLSLIKKHQCTLWKHIIMTD